MAGVTGLEPATSGVTGRRSNQLSYTPAGNTYSRSDIKPVMYPDKNPVQKETRVVSLSCIQVSVYCYGGR